MATIRNNSENYTPNIRHIYTELMVGVFTHSEKHPGNTDTLEIPTKKRFFVEREMPMPFMLEGSM